MPPDKDKYSTHSLLKQLKTAEKQNRSQVDMADTRPLGATFEMKMLDDLACKD